MSDDIRREARVQQAMFGAAPSPALTREALAAALFDIDAGPYRFPDDATDWAKVEYPKRAGIILAALDRLSKT